MRWMPPGCLFLVFHGHLMRALCKWKLSAGLQCNLLPGLCRWFVPAGRRWIQLPRLPLWPGAAECGRLGLLPLWTRHLPERGRPDDVRCLPTRDGEWRRREGLCLCLPRLCCRHLRVGARADGVPGVHPWDVQGPVGRDQLPALQAWELRGADRQQRVQTLPSWDVWDCSRGERRDVCALPGWHLRHLCWRQCCCPVHSLPCRDLLDGAGAMDGRLRAMPRWVLCCGGERLL